MGRGSGFLGVVKGSDGFLGVMGDNGGFLRSTGRCWWLLGVMGRGGSFLVVVEIGDRDLSSGGDLLGALTGINSCLRSMGSGGGILGCTVDGVVGLLERNGRRCTSLRYSLKWCSSQRNSWRW